jgi:hypothetical protein
MFQPASQFFQPQRKMLLNELFERRKLKRVRLECVLPHVTDVHIPESQLLQRAQKLSEYAQAELEQALLESKLAAEEVREQQFIMRVWVHNDYTNQPLKLEAKQTTLIPDVEVPAEQAEVMTAHSSPGWTLRVQAQLLTKDRGDPVIHTFNGNTAPFCFSNFVRRLQVYKTPKQQQEEVDQTAAQVQLAGQDIYTWRREATGALVDGVEITQRGSEDTDVTVVLDLHNAPQVFAFEPHLSAVLDGKTQGTTTQLVQGLLKATQQHEYFFEPAKLPATVTALLDWLKLKDGVTIVEYVSESAVPALNEIRVKNGGLLYHFADFVRVVDYNCKRVLKPIKIEYTVKTSGDCSDYVQTYDIPVTCPVATSNNWAGTVAARISRKSNPYHDQNIKVPRLAPDYNNAQILQNASERINDLDASIRNSITEYRSAKSRRTLLTAYANDPVGALNYALLQAASDGAVEATRAQDGSEANRAHFWARNFVPDAVDRWLQRSEYSEVMETKVEPHQNWGYLKPAPVGEELRNMLAEKQRREELDRQQLATMSAPLARKRYGAG